MKHTGWKIAAAVLLLGGGLWAGSLLNVTAEGAGLSTQPGTADDPVVTKSYVDQQIQKALGGGGTGASGGTKPDPAPGKPAPVPVPAAGSPAVEVVTVKPGQLLIAKAGTEFVVRGGKAVVYSMDADGAADLTEGVDVADGKAAVSNHLLSFPREGRGIQGVKDQKMSLTVLVRGGYVLKSAE